MEETKKNIEENIKKASKQMVVGIFILLTFGWVCAIFIPVGIFVLSTTVPELIETKDYKETTATIIDYHTINDEKNYSIQYQIDGKTINNTMLDIGDYNKGDTLTIYYDPNNIYAFSTNDKYNLIACIFVIIVMNIPFLIAFIPAIKYIYSGLKCLSYYYYLQKKEDSYLEIGMKYVSDLRKEENL